jgi:hypothetical protein
MSKKEKQTSVDWQELPELERMKYEVAKELGLLEVVREKGWKGLSSKDTGKIGGIVAKRRKK